MPADLNVSFLKMARKIALPPPLQPLSLSQAVHLFAVERDGLEYTILCSVFLFHGNIFAFFNLYFYLFCFYIFPYYYNYTVYFTMSIEYQNDMTSKRQEDKKDLQILLP